MHRLFIVLIAFFLCSNTVSAKIPLANQQAVKQQVINRVKQYFTNLDRVKMTFTQTSKTSGNAHGYIVIHKPDHLLIQYTTPHQDRFLLNDRMSLEYFDSKLGETSDLPLPKIFAMILYNEFDEINLLKMREFNGLLYIIVAYEDSSAQFVFSKSPFKLISWTVTQNSTVIRTHIDKIEHISD